jgi:hypothetical protein
MKNYVLAIVMAMIVMSGCSNKEDASVHTKLTAVPASSVTAIKQVEPPKFRKFLIEYISQDKINDDFDRSSIVDIFNALKSFGKIGKTEFETTDDFKKRSQEERSKPYFKDLSVSDLLAFEVGFKYSGLRYKYDADKEILRVTTGNQMARTNSNSMFLFGSGGTEKSNSVGQNAFGATVDVQMNKNTDYGILSKNIPFFKYRIDILDVTHLDDVKVFEKNIPRAEAENFIKNLRCILIVKPTFGMGEYTFTSSYGIEPTRDNTTGYLSVSNFVVVDVLNMVIYDASNKNILINLSVDLKMKKK